MATAEKSWRVSGAGQLMLARAASNPDGYVCAQGPALRTAKRLVEAGLLERKSSRYVFEITDAGRVERALANAVPAVRGDH